MQYITPKVVAESKISVTTSVATLFGLVNTAGSVNDSQNYYTQTNKATVLRISPEDGSIRWLVGINPTTTLGNLISQGATVDLVGINLSDLRLISTTGTVACSIQFIAALESAAIIGSSFAGGSSASSISSITPGVGATNLGKAEDAQHTSGDVGVEMLGVSNETMASFGANGDYTPIATDIKGRSVVTGSIRTLKGNQKTTITNSTSETTIVTQVASTFCDLYGLVLSNSSASAVNITIKDATAGTTRFIFSVPAGTTTGFMLPESAAHKQAVVNTNWTATCSASLTSIEITALFVQNT